MSTYLRWSLRQLYLLAFWPTRFKREIHALSLLGRLRYILNMLPWIVVLAALGNLVVGLTFETLQLDYAWASSWSGVMHGVVIGVVISVAVSVVAGRGLKMALGITSTIVGDVALSIIFGVATGMVGGLLQGFIEQGLKPAVALIVVFSVIFGTAFGIVVVMAEEIDISMTEGLRQGLMFIVVLSIVFGIKFGFALWVIFGVVGIAAFCLTWFRLPTYPLDVMLSTAVYLVVRQRPHTARQMWRWCPVVWNEMIWLPLPFVSDLLALLVQQDRHEGFQQIVFIATQRRRQGDAARAALAEVAINDLGVQSVPEMATVTEGLHWTSDVPADMPAELTAAVRNFERIGTHVGQYLVLHSAYRQGETLLRALAEVEALRRHLVLTQGRFAPRLLLVASAWHRLLQSEHETLQAQTRSTQEIPNPFIFGNPVVETAHNVFTGRWDIVRQLEQNLLGTLQAPTLLLHGARRMGKTSILNQLPRLLGPDFTPVVLDCQNPAVTESLVSLLRYLCAVFSRGLRRRRVVVEPLPSMALAHEPFAAFDDWLDTVVYHMPAGMRVLLCLDEYESLQATLAAGWGEAFLDALRHLLQHRPEIVLMFVGASTFEELGPAWTARFLNARRLRISFLSWEEVLPLLTRPIPEFDLTYAPDALAALFAATNGQPFLTQAVAFELIQWLNEQQRKDATVADVEASLNHALVSGGEYFANIWSDTPTAGRTMLHALAWQQHVPDFPRTRTWLQGRDILNETGTFAVPMMQRWVRERAQS